MLKLLIFDLDGTLVDTSRDITNAINHAVAPFGVKPLSIETAKSMVGSGISKLLGELIDPGIKEQGTTKKNVNKADAQHSSEKAIERFLDHYSGHLLDNTKPYPKVKETLSELRRYKKAVISNKREILCRQVLKGLNLSIFFDIILGSDSVSEKKPSPIPVFEVLKRLGISKNETVMTGDSNFDIEAGRAAGIKTIAVTYGYRSKELLKDADFMIDSFEELLPLLPLINKSLSD